MLAATESKVGTLTKSAGLVVLAVLTASSALLGQTGGNLSAKPQNPTNVLNARRIVELSVAATERNWYARDNYAYVERDEDRRLDSLGHAKRENVDITKTIVVNGAPFERRRAQWAPSIG